MQLDYPVIASEFLRALRGARSQTAFSRRLGFRTNVAYAWESGRAFPTASVVLKAATRLGIDVPAALGQFYKSPPPWLGEPDPTSCVAIASLLDDLRGRTSIVELARTTGRNRFAIARWLSGQAEPRLPDFFRLVEGASLRLLDWISLFVEPSKMPCIAKAWAQLEATRRSAYDHPWTVGIQRALELSDYQALPRHRRGWIAKRIGITVEEEQQGLKLLAETGQIHLVRGRWESRQVLAVDTRRDPAAEFGMKSWWTKVALQRLEQESPGLFSYNVFSVSEKDLAKILDLYRGTFRQVRAIVANSEPSERIALLSLQLVTLDGREP